MIRYQHLIFKQLLICLIGSFGVISGVRAQDNSKDTAKSVLANTDSIVQPVNQKKSDTLFRSGLLDSMLEANSGAYFINAQHMLSRKLGRLDQRSISNLPVNSLQQLLKGQATGLYVNEPSGEPGTESLMFLHGITAPLLNKKVAYNQQPAVYIDGIP